MSGAYETTIWQTDRHAHASPETRARIALLEERSRQIVHAHLPVTLTGWCDVCQRLTPIDFRANFGQVVPNTGAFNPAYSETGSCTVCLVSSRMRFAVELLRRHAPGKRLFLTEHVTRLRERLLTEYADLTSSEYLGDHEPGAIVDGIRHEDLHRLSFADHSFDAILCLDVLEHVDDPTRCVDEMVRVLAPGGIAVLTFPFFSGRDTSVRRSQIVNKEIKYLLPAEYHGNPLGGGALVFWELSWDWLEQIKRSLPVTIRVLHYWSALNLHMGGNRLAVLVTRAL